MHLLANDAHSSDNKASQILVAELSVQFSAPTYHKDIFH